MCILIPLLVGLISALLGYLIGNLGKKSKCSKCDNLNIDLDICKKRSLKLQADLDNLKLSSASKSSGFVSKSEALVLFNSDLAFAALGKKVVQDDLKIVEGIGPKIEELFHAAGVKTWKQLAESSVERCQEILNSGDERFTIHNPGTWPKQAEMAYNGKWNELKKWQNDLDGGK